MNSPRLLLVEDNPLDVALTRRVFARQGTEIPISLAEDGQEAIEYLTSGNEPLPSLILMDVNMPRMDGIEALKEIRGNLALRHIPVIMLTTSTRSEDVLRSYAAGANSYLVKPVDLAEFQGVMDTLRHYWTEIVTLPETQQPFTSRGAA
jgi:CheY-like chemotaxis protein